jgi:hypothetical protein
MPRGTLDVNGSPLPPLGLEYWLLPYFTEQKLNRAVAFLALSHRGRNSSGELGDGTSTRRLMSRAVAVGGLLLKATSPSVFTPAPLRSTDGVLLGANDRGRSATERPGQRYAAGSGRWAPLRGGERRSGRQSRLLRCRHSAPQSSLTSQHNPSYSQRDKLNSATRSCPSSKRNTSSAQAPTEDLSVFQR